MKHIRDIHAVFIVEVSTLEILFFGQHSIMYPYFGGTIVFTFIPNVVEVLNLLSKRHMKLYFSAISLVIIHALPSINLDLLSV